MSGPYPNRGISLQKTLVGSHGYARRVLPPSETAQQVARRLSEKKVSSILVLGENGDPHGIITEKDLVAKVLAPENADPRILTAGKS